MQGISQGKKSVMSKEHLLLDRLLLAIAGKSVGSRQET